MTRRAVVIGSSGQIGRASIRALAVDGWRVISLRRGSAKPPPEWAGLGVEDVQADRDDDAALRAATAGADVVIDTIAFDATHAQQLASLRDVGSLVVISSLAVYADSRGRSLNTATGPADFPRYPVPMTERQALVPAGPENYATRKVAMEQTLAATASVPVTVLRPGAIYGPGSAEPRELWPLLRILSGRRAIPLAYGGESRFHTSAAANIAELIRLAAANPGSRVLNAADPEALPVRELVRLVAAAAGRGGEVVTFSGPPAVEGPTAGAGRSPWSAPAACVVDMSAAVSELGYSAVGGYADLVPETVRWLLEQLDGRSWEEAFPQLAQGYGPAFADVAAEDALLRTAGELS